MITLKRLNVVRQVETEEKAARLEALGFVRQGGKPSKEEKAPKDKGGKQPKEGKEGKDGGTDQPSGGNGAE